MLSGSHPFLHESGLIQIEETIKNAEYNAGTLKCDESSGIPKKCAEVIAKLLVKDTAGRYKTARNVLNDWMGEELVQCPRCGNENKKDASYCSSCGASMKGEVTAGQTILETTYNKSLLLFRSDPEQAIDVMKMALQKHDKFPRGWSHLGYMYNSIRQYSNSIDACKNALKIDPKIPEPYQTKGFAESNLGMYEEAIQDFTKALDYVKPDDDRRRAQIYALRAYTHMLAGDNKVACEDATLALRLDPLNERAEWLVKTVCK